MKRTPSAAIIGSLIAAGSLYAGAAFAHHSFAMFDRTTTDVVEGTIKDFQWTSPHIWIEMVAPDKDGKLIDYSFEAGPPSNGRGWSRHSFKPGDKAKITYHPLRAGGSGGEFMQALLANGATVPERNAGGPQPRGE